MSSKPVLIGVAVFVLCSLSPEHLLTALALTLGANTIRALRLSRRTTSLLRIPSIAMIF